MLTFQDNILAGTTLVRPAINSPDYVAGTSGWAVKIDGSAEFNNVVIRGGLIEGAPGLYYNGPPALGNMVGSISGVAGTDALGNEYPQGVNAYALIDGIVVAIGLNQTLNGGALGTLPGVTGQDLYHPGYTAAGMFAASSGEVSFARAGLTTGQSSNTDVAAVIGGQSAADSGIARGTWQISAGQVRLGNDVTLLVDDVNGVTIFAVQPFPPPAVSGSGIWANLNGDLNVYDSGDQNTYRIGRFTSFGNSGQLINSTSPAAVSGMSINVGPYNYHITGAVNFTGTAAAGSAQLGFGGGTATISHADGGAYFTTPGAGLANASNFNGALALAGSPVLTATVQRWWFDIWVTFSGAGTFILRAQEGTAGDTFTINSGYMRAETY